MKATCTVNSGMSTVETIDGRRMTYQAEPQEIEFYLRCNAAEANEVARRLQGMPGWPELGEEMEREPPNRNFNRKIDA